MFADKMLHAHVGQSKALCAISNIDAHVNGEYRSHHGCWIDRRGLAEQYRKLPRGIQPRVDKVICRLAQWPKVSGVKPLVGCLAGSLRIRTGDYRIVFRVSGDNVIAWKIGDRKDVYLD